MHLSDTLFGEGSIDIGWIGRWLLNLSLEGVLEFGKPVLQIYLFWANMFGNWSIILIIFGSTFFPLNIFMVSLFYRQQIIRVLFVFERLLPRQLKFWNPVSRLELEEERFLFGMTNGWRMIIFVILFLMSTLLKLIWDWGTFTITTAGVYLISQLRYLSIFSSKFKVSSSTSLPKTSRFGLIPQQICTLLKVVISGWLQTLFLLQVRLSRKHDNEFGSSTS